MRVLTSCLLMALGGCSVQISGDAANVVGLVLIGASAYSYQTGRASSPTLPPPDMAPDRTVNEVDCSQPFDPSLGNIRCK
jgi:hypothetical protein